MNNERYNQIISEVYSKYLDYLQENEIHGIWYDLEIFINKIKTDDEFSKTWDLKIEERELSDDERYDWYIQTHNKNLTRGSNQYDMGDILNSNNCPTKLITLTYNNETVEVYE